MKRSLNYNLRLPERGARDGEANDSADIEDLTYDLSIIDNLLYQQQTEDERLNKDKLEKKHFWNTKATKP